MIYEVDEALTKLLRRLVTIDDALDIAMDAPTRDWSARRNAPTLNVFLYDIREDLQRRTRDRIDERDQSGRIVARRAAPRHFVLSYLITAWAARPQDEHRLLSVTLAGLLARESFAADDLPMGLRELGLTVPVTVALPPEDRSFADFWSALGGELRPSLDVRVTAPILPGSAEPAGPPVRTVVPGLRPRVARRSA